MQSLYLFTFKSFKNKSTSYLMYFSSFYDKKAYISVTYNKIDTKLNKSSKCNDELYLTSHE